MNWVIAMRHGKRRKLRESGTEEGQLVDKIEQFKSQIRAKVEHPFYWVKVHFGHRKTRYRGLAKTPLSCIACLPWRTCFYRNDLCRWRDKSA